MSDRIVKRRKALRQLAATTILATLCACENNNDVTAVGEVTPSYRTSDYTLAGVGRDMWVIVLGMVPGADKTTLVAQTLSTMQQHASITTRFVTTPHDYNREYKTVMVFNGPDNLQANALCRTPHQIITSLPGDSLRLQAVFCRDDQSISEVHSEARGGNSLQNPNFSTLIRETMNSLYAAPQEGQQGPPP